MMKHSDGMLKNILVNGSNYIIMLKIFVLRMRGLRGYLELNFLDEKAA
jgi:hypothetical protein